MLFSKNRKSNVPKQGFESEIIGNVLVIRLQGNLVGIDAFDKFKEFIIANLEKNIKNFVINLADINYISSIGLGMLIEALTKIKNSSGIMYLCHIDKAEPILRTTRLINVFQYTDNEENAIKIIHKSF